MIGSGHHHRVLSGGCYGLLQIYFAFEYIACLISVNQLYNLQLLDILDLWQYTQLILKLLQRKRVAQYRRLIGATPRRNAMVDHISRKQLEIIVSSVIE